MSKLNVTRRDLVKGAALGSVAALAATVVPAPALAAAPSTDNSDWLGEPPRSD